MRRILKLTLTCLVVAIALPALAGDLSWKAGQKIETIALTQVDVSRSLPDGSRQEAKQSHRMQYDIVVREIDAAGNAICHLTFSRIAAKQESATGGFEYDSGDAEKSDVDNPQVAVTRAMVGAELVLKINPKRECLSVVGTEKIIDRIVETFPAEQREVIRGMVAGTMNDTTMREQFSVLFVQVPDDAKVGSSWTKNADLNAAFGSVTTPIEYNVAKIDGDTVSLTATAAKALGAKPDPTMQAEVTVTSLKLSGTTTLDRSHPLLTDTDQTLEVDATLLIQETFEVPTRVKQVTKVRSRLVE
jgi:hypothetical protein